MQFNVCLQSAFTTPATILFPVLQLVNLVLLLKFIHSSSQKDIQNQHEFPYLAAAEDIIRSGLDVEVSEDSNSLVSGLF